MFLYLRSIKTVRAKAKDQQVFEQSLHKLSRQASEMLVQARQKQPFQRKQNSKIVQGSTHD